MIGVVRNSYESTRDIGGAAVPPISPGILAQEGQRLAGDLSAHTTDERTAREVVFYRLRKKFVDHERSIPEDVRSVLYYTLAIGHHTGVIDCLKPRLVTSREIFADVLAQLEPGEARDKLSGIEKFGEIEVKKEHVPILKSAVLIALENMNTLIDGEMLLDERLDASSSVTATDALSWLEEFLCLLEEIQCEPCVYAMGRRVTC
ncbi:formate hydrogenlyase maturation HycH family protein [Eggerthellaceae bacterium 3-80]|nr:hypothetical protein D7W09_06720 [bacterium D16-34]